MAIVPVITFENPHSTVTVSINNANNRMTTVDWVILLQDGWGVNTKIWNNGNLAIDRDDFVDGSENVPGNYSVTEHTDPLFGFTYYTLPPELRFQHQVIPPP